jgi:hypothetical protein
MRQALTSRHRLACRHIRHIGRSCAARTGLANIATGRGIYDEIAERNRTQEVTDNEGNDHTQFNAPPFGDVYVDWRL